MKNEKKLTIKQAKEIDYNRWKKGYNQALEDVNKWRANRILTWEKYPDEQTYLLELNEELRDKLIELKKEVQENEKQNKMSQL